MVDNPGKSQLIPAMMVVVLLDLTNKVHVHVHLHACMHGAAVVHGAVLQCMRLCIVSKWVSMYMYDLALLIYSAHV